MPEAYDADAWRGAYLQFAHSFGDGRVRTRSGLTLADSGLLWPAANACLVQKPETGPADLHAVLDAAVEYYSSRGLGWILLLPPESAAAPEGDARACASHGLTAAHELAELDTGAEPPPEFRISGYDGNARGHAGLSRRGAGRYRLVSLQRPAGALSPGLRRGAAGNRGAARPRRP